MKKIYLLICIISMFHVKTTRAQITFTIVNTSGSNSITCANPTLNLICISNYTTAFVTYTLAGPGSYTNIGSSFAISVPGNYTITAFVNTQVNSTQTLAIGINTTAPASAVSPTTQNITCSFTSVTTVTATANPSVNVTHQFLTPGGASLSIPGYSATFIPGATGTHTHILINDINGCKTSKLFMVNSVSGIPTLTLSCPQNYTLGCNSNSLCNVALAGTAGGPGSVSYTIMSAASSTNYVTNSQNLYGLSLPGTYTAIVHDNNSSCEARIPFSISSNTVNPNLSLFVNTQTLSCLNAQTALFGISTTPNVSYLWGIPGSTATPAGYTIGVNTTANLTSSVIGQYTLTITDPVNACITTTLVDMYQNVYPPNALIASSGAATLTCLNSSLTLINQSTTGIPPGTYGNAQPVVASQWMGPAPQPSAGATSTYVASTVGVYTMYVSDLNNGCTSQANITVFNGRDYPVVNNPAGPPPYCLDPPTTAIDISPALGGAISTYTFYWIIPGTATTSGQNTATLTTNAVGAYTVIVTNSVSGCSSAGTLTVTVCTGIGDLNFSDQSIHFFPNPNAGVLNYALSSDIEKADLEIYNCEGKLVHKSFLIDAIGRIDMTSLDPGLYMLILRENGKVLENHRILRTE
ncbi:MAG TPA: T9SS type A sorting domain-containing protein [Bacteroidia bacterium]|nr:T9SS type A sorting domain-containing protein [Bacteroidia bacterium]